MNIENLIEKFSRFIISHKPNQIIFIHNLEKEELNDIIKYVSVGQATIQKYDTNDPSSENTRLKQIENFKLINVGHSLIIFDI